MKWASQGAWKEPGKGRYIVEQPVARSTTQAEHRGWTGTLGVRFLGPKQAVRLRAQLTPSRRHPTTTAHLYEARDQETNSA